MITELTGMRNGAITIATGIKVGTRAAKQDGMAEVSLRDKRRNIAITIAIAGLVTTEAVTTARPTLATALRW